MSVEPCREPSSDSNTNNKCLCASGQSESDLCELRCRFHCSLEALPLKALKSQTATSDANPWAACCQWQMSALACEPRNRMRIHQCTTGTGTTGGRLRRWTMTTTTSAMPANRPEGAKAAGYCQLSFISPDRFGGMERRQLARSHPPYLLAAAASQRKAFRKPQPR